MQHLPNVFESSQFSQNMASAQLLMRNHFLAYYSGYQNHIGCSSESTILQYTQLTIFKNVRGCSSLSRQGLTSKYLQHVDVFKPAISHRVIQCRNRHFGPTCPHWPIMSTYTSPTCLHLVHMPPNGSYPCTRHVP